MDNTYIILWRSIQNNPLWLSEKFTRGQAWVDLLILANHKQTHLRVRGIMVKVERGQVAWAKESLSERWKWSRGKVIRFLSELEENKMIAQQTTQQNKRLLSLISIVNYDKYQKTVQETDNKQYRDKELNKSHVIGSIESVRHARPQDFENIKSFEELEITPSTDPYIHHRKMEGRKVLAKVWDGWQPNRRGDKWTVNDSFLKEIDWTRDGELLRFKQAVAKYATSDDVSDGIVMGLGKFLKQWENWV